MLLPTFVVRRQLHLRERVQVFAALVEQVIPSPNKKSEFRGYSRLACQVCLPYQTTLVLIVDEVQGIIRPCLLDLPDVLLKSHLRNDLVREQCELLTDAPLPVLE